MTYKNISLTLLTLIFVVLLVSVLYEFSIKNKSTPVVLHDSYFSTKDISERGFHQAGNISSIDGVIGILVNHHLLASNLIAEEFLHAQNMKPDVVVIFSPNHFTRGDGTIIMSNADWRTPYGILEGDHRDISKLTSLKTSFVDELPFDKEHGVSGIIPFVKKIFPDAKVLPVIFKTYATEENVKQYIDQLITVLPRKILFVCSFDFSHDSTLTIAKQRDAVSVPIMEANNLEKVSDVSVDSKTGLYACMYSMSKYNATFHLDHNTNSALITGELAQPDVTSYITGYYK